MSPPDFSSPAAPAPGGNPVRSREHLLHMLAEAAELEHNLLCSYLYAAFSLKKDLDEGLLPDELDAVRRWHASIMRVCMEEMSHLAQVANLMVAVGSRPHFDRPNLPVAAGYHPARVQVALAPFDLDTLDHFIYLERPETSPLEDAAPFRPERPYERQAEVGTLMPSSPDYATIGEFYELLTAGIRGLCDELGPATLFVGSTEYQLHPDDVGMADLSVVVDLDSALKALHLIIVQGEGAPDSAETSHFEAFNQIKQEFLALSARRAEFAPSRNVARNPVMRRPPSGADRVHVDGAEAAPVLDVANAVYALMLRCLTIVFDSPRSQAGRRKALLGAAIGLMKALAVVADELTRLPANGRDGVHAGVTFAMLRSTEGLIPGIDLPAILRQRFERLLGRVRELGIGENADPPLADQLVKLRDSLATAD